MRSDQLLRILYEKPDTNFDLMRRQKQVLYLFIDRHGSSIALRLGQLFLNKHLGKTEYAPVMELVDMRDLGAVTSVKKFAINQVKAGSSCFYKRGSNNAFRLGSLAV